MITIIKNNIPNGDQLREWNHLKIIWSIGSLMCKSNVRLPVVVKKFILSFDWQHILFKYE